MSFTVPTFEQTYDNELGRFGLSFPRGYIVVIASGVATAYPGAHGLVDPTDIWDVADTGSGEKGKGVFRYGKTYSISTTEASILTNAGYTAS